MVKLFQIVTTCNKVLIKICLLQGSGCGTVIIDFDTRVPQIESSRMQFLIKYLFFDDQSSEMF